MFFSTAGLNMPYIFVKLAWGEDFPLPAKKINPLTPDLAWVRGMDREPVLTSLAAIESCESRLQERIGKLQRTAAVEASEREVKVP